LQVIGENTREYSFWFSSPALLREGMNFAY
jgi:hypothetical protein